MGSGSHRPRVLLAAALLALGLGGCNLGRSVADDCWIDQSHYDAAQRFRAGLRARNLPPSDGAWAVADARIERARKALRACRDGASGPGRPAAEQLSDAHTAAAGGHGA
jgi:hypothetical protein